MARPTRRARPPSSAGSSTREAHRAGAGPSRGAQSADRGAAPPALRAGSDRRWTPARKGQGRRKPHRRSGATVERGAGPARAGAVALPFRLLQAAARHSRQSARYPYRGRPLRVQSEVFFDTGKPRSTSPKAGPSSTRSQALLELEKKIPGEIAWVLRVDGHTDVRPIYSPQFKNNWEALRRARDLGRAVPHQQGRVAATAGGRGLRRIPAHRCRQDRGSLQPQPPHRAQVDEAVSAPAFTLRPYAPPTKKQRSSCGGAPGSSPIPGSIFPRGSIGGGSAGARARAGGDNHGGRSGRRAGWLRHRRSDDFDLDQIVVAPEALGEGVAAALIAEAKRISRRTRSASTPTTCGPFASTRRRVSSFPAKRSSWRSGAPVHKMSWRPSGS